MGCFSCAAAMHESYSCDDSIFIEVPLHHQLTLFESAHKYNHPKQVPQKLSKIREANFMAMQSSAGSLNHKSIILFAAISLLLQAIVQLEAVDITECSGDGAGASLIYVDIENCGEKDKYCPYVVGQNFSTEFAFRASKSEQSQTI